MITSDGNNLLNIEEVFASKGRTKILHLLAICGEMNISEIVKKTSLNHLNVKNHLKMLVKLNFIQEKSFGRIKIYRFKIENKKAKSLKNLIEFWENKPLD